MTHLRPDSTYLVRQRKPKEEKKKITGKQNHGEKNGEDAPNFSKKKGLKTTRANGIVGVQQQAFPHG